MTLQTRPLLPACCMKPALSPRPQRGPRKCLPVKCGPPAALCPVSKPPALDRHTRAFEGKPSADSTVGERNTHGAENAFSPGPGLLKTQNRLRGVSLHTERLAFCWCYKTLSCWV